MKNLGRLSVLLAIMLLAACNTAEPVIPVTVVVPLASPASVLPEYAGTAQITLKGRRVTEISGRYDAGVVVAVPGIQVQDSDGAVIYDYFIWDNQLEQEGSFSANLKDRSLTLSEKQLEQFDKGTLYINLYNGDTVVLSGQIIPPLTVE